MGEDLEGVINQFLVLAKEWGVFSKQINGFEPVFYGKGYIQCYFDRDGSDYKIVTFNFTDYRKSINVSIFYNEPTISIPISQVKNLPQILKRSREILDTEKAAYLAGNYTAIKERIATLESELHILEGKPRRWRWRWKPRNVR